MYDEVKTLQMFSKKRFDMIPITIKQLQMIKREYESVRDTV